MLLDPILASGIITQWDFKMCSVFIYMIVFDAWLTSHGGMKGWDPVMSQRKIGNKQSANTITIASSSWTWRNLLEESLTFVGRKDQAEALCDRIAIQAEGPGLVVCKLGMGHKCGFPMFSTFDKLGADLMVYKWDMNGIFSKDKPVGTSIINISCFNSWLLLRGSTTKNLSINLWFPGSEEVVITTITLT